MDHKPHDYEPILKILIFSILADKWISANKVFLIKLTKGSIVCPVLLSQLNFKIPSFRSRITYPFFTLLCTTNIIPVIFRRLLLMTRTYRFLSVNITLTMARVHIFLVRIIYTYIHILFSTLARFVIKQINT